MKRNKIIAGFFCAALVVSPAFAEDFEDEDIFLEDDLAEDVFEDDVDLEDDFSEEDVAIDEEDPAITEDDADETVADETEEPAADEDETVAEDTAESTEEVAEEAPASETSEELKKMARFNPVLNVRNIKKETEQASILVITPKGETTEASVNRPYPHGSTFNVTDGVSFRLLFAPASYVVVSGPAKFSVNVSENNRHATIDVEYGDMNIRVSKTVKKDQVTLKTPIGNFESLVGIFNLRVDTADGCDKNCMECGGVVFRTATGSARFVGANYGVTEITDNNAFRSKIISDEVRGTATTFAEDISGRVGVFNVSVASHAGAEGQEIQMTPSSRLRISREKPAGSKNWVVTVMGFHSDGSIKSYYSYVENREDPLYWIPEQINVNEGGEAVEEEETTEEADTEDDYSEEYPEEMGNFDDELM
jgi:hypothetical protein